MTNLEDTFEYAKDALKLSDTEKAFGRAHLQALMQERPLRAPVRSPLSRQFFSYARYAAVAVFFLAVSGGGVTYAASTAEPSDPLYVVKVKVTEPVQVALTFDQKDRTDLEVKLVDQRLKEVAGASVHEPLTPSQAALVTGSLSAQINHAQDDISSLQDSQVDDALASATDLASTLSAHALILKKVQEASPEASSTIAAVVSTVSDELTQTNQLVDTAQDAVADTPEAALDAPADDQAQDTDSALAEVKQDVENALATFDASDREDINAALAGIQATIADAQEKDTAGDAKSALLLYTDADEKLTALSLTIEADQALDIDVIDASTTDSGD